MAERFDVLAPDRPGHGGNIDELRLRRTHAETAEEYRQLLAQVRGTNDEAHELVSHIAAHQDQHPDGLAGGDGGRRRDGIVVVGVGDAGVLALKTAASGQADVRGLVLVGTTVLMPEQVSIDDILAQLEESDLDFRGLTDVMSAVLSTKDASPYVDWVMAQPNMDDLSETDRALVRAMLADNTLPALFAPTYSPGDVGPDELAALSAPILDLRAGPTPWSDLRLDGLLTDAELTREEIPASPPLFALSAPQAFADRVARFVHELG